MGRRTLSLIVCLAVVFSAAFHSEAVAQLYRYPRVYSPTGSIYGPSLAHYMYQRQYGQPWHGLGGYYSSRSPDDYNIRLYSPALDLYWLGAFRDGCTGSGFGYGFPRYIGNYYTPPVYVYPSA